MYLIHNNAGPGIYSNKNRSFTKSVNEQFKNEKATRLSSEETGQLYSVVQTVDRYKIEDDKTPSAFL